MKIKPFVRLVAAVVVGLSSMLVVNIPETFAASNDCLWNGSASADFNTASNWSNCNSAVPSTGDNLVFDNTTIPSTGADLVDNITSANTFGSITFEGTGSTGYSISISGASNISLSGNITDTTTGSGGTYIDAPLVFSGTSTTVSVANKLTLLGDTNTLTVDNNHTITFSGSGTITSNYALVGTANNTFNFSMGSSGVFRQETNSPNLEGQVNVTSGTLELSSNDDPYPDMLSGATGITVSNGATLYFYGSFASSGTIDTPITVGGTGVAACADRISGNTVDCGAIEASLEFGSNLTLAGPITLTADSQFNDNDTLTVTGPLSGAFTVENAAGKLVVNSSNNTSKTPNGTYDGGQLKNDGSGSKAPGTPDTGLALVAAHPIATFATAVAAAALLLIVARRLRPVNG